MDLFDNLYVDSLRCVFVSSVCLFCFFSRHHAVALWLRETDCAGPARGVAIFAGICWSPVSSLILSCVCDLELRGARIVVLFHPPLYFVHDRKDKLDGMRGSDLEKKVKEATNNENWGAPNSLLREISRATFD